MAHKKMEATTKNGWRETTIAEIAYINPATSLPKGTMATHIAMDDLAPFTRRVSQHRTKKYTGGQKFRNGDTLLARITPSLENGKTAFVDVLDEGKVGFGSTEFIVLREKEGSSDAKFLFYFSISPTFREMAIKSMTGTSGRQRVQTDAVVSEKFLFPSYDEQREIAAILSSTDDKIELLRKQNETLEQIARTTFNEWFTSDDTGETAHLADFVDHIREQVLPAKTPTDIFSHYSIPAFDAEKTPVREAGTAILSNKYLVQENVVLFSKLNPETPRVWLIFTPFTNGICSTEFQVLKPKKKSLLPFVYGILRFSEYARQLASMVQGTSSSHQRLRPEDILSIEFPRPKDETVNTYGGLAYPILKKVEDNENQMRALAGIRDFLLPRLMSGDLRVEN